MNAIRDVEAKLMEEVCYDVKIEPQLIPTNEEQTHGITGQNARLDVSARGIWSQYERTLFYVKVSYPNAASYMKKSLPQLYRDNGLQKKNAYNDRVLNNEKATFTPLVFTTTGGMGPECTRLNKRIAELIARKRKECYSDVMRHVRTRLRFALLRCTLIAIRGFRGKGQSDDEDELEEISFNLIPER